MKIAAFMLMLKKKTTKTCERILTYPHLPCSHASSSSLFSQRFATSLMKYTIHSINYDGSVATLLSVSF